MVASLRPILLILLVLLQIAAPLVHAHVGGDGGISGLHVHTLQNFHANGNNQHAVKAIHEVGAMVAIVELGSAIQTPQSDHDSPPGCLFEDQPSCLGVHRCVGRINFSPHPEPAATSPFPTSHASRAPPI